MYNMHMATNMFSEGGVTVNLAIPSKYAVSFARFHCCGVWPSCVVYLVAVMV